MPCKLGKKQEAAGNNLRGEGEGSLEMNTDQQKPALLGDLKLIVQSFASVEGIWHSWEGGS